MGRPVSPFKRLFWTFKRLVFASSDRAASVLEAGEITPEPDNSQDSSVLCVVANIRQTVAFGPGGVESRAGHRRFSPGTKVYVLAPSWDWTSGTFECVALRRRSRRFVRQVLDRRFLENWRVSREYSPSVLKHIRVNRLGKGWSGDLAAKVVEHELALTRRPG